MLVLININIINIIIYFVNIQRKKKTLFVVICYAISVIIVHVLKIVQEQQKARPSNGCVSAVRNPLNRYRNSVFVDTSINRTFVNIRGSALGNTKESVCYQVNHQT